MCTQVGSFHAVGHLILEEIPIHDDNSSNTPDVRDVTAVQIEMKAVSKVRMNNPLTDWLSERERDRQRERVTDWLTDWPMDRQTDRQSDWLTDGVIYWRNDGPHDWLTDRQKDKKTHRHTNRWSDWFADWRTDGRIISRTETGYALLLSSTV